MTCIYLPYSKIHPDTARWERCLGKSRLLALQLHRQLNRFGGCAKPNAATLSYLKHARARGPQQNLYRTGQDDTVANHRYKHCSPGSVANSLIQHTCVYREPDQGTKRPDRHILKSLKICSLNLTCNHWTLPNWNGSTLPNLHNGCHFSCALSARITSFINA